MPNLDSLFSKYDRLVIFDTETTGLQYARDEIIELPPSWWSAPAACPR